MFKMLQHMYNLSIVILIGIPILIILRLIILKIFRNKNYYINWFHEVGVIFFISYCIALIIQMFFTNFQEKINEISINLIPFNKLKEFLEIVIYESRVEYLLIEILGNIIVFIIIGFMLPLLWRKFENIKLVLIMCLICSVTIETIQLMLPRCSDVDDIIMNIIGGIIGYGLYIIVKKGLTKYINLFKY